MKRLVILFLAFLIGGILIYVNYQDSKIESFEGTNMFRPLKDDVSTEATYVHPINIEYLRSLRFNSNEVEIEEELSPGSNYKRYLASYTSGRSKIFGLLTIPISDPPKDGFSAIVFNHGYIPPHQYITTERYVSYVDYLARNGFVVFKIDLRGHGDSEGVPTGSYFSPGYTIDAISALKSLQKREDVNAEKIGMWGHSMAGNLVMRAMLLEEDIKAGVIWAGAVYSYEDFSKYRLSDNSYVRRPRTEEEETQAQEEEKEDLGKEPVQETNPQVQEILEELQKLREDPKEVNFENDFWLGISLTSNINYLTAPVQLHHAVNDPVVNIGYARDLATVLEKENKEYEIFEYEGGGHNIESPYFETAMKRTTEFFKEHLDFVEASVE